TIEALTSFFGDSMSSVAIPFPLSALGATGGISGLGLVIRMTVDIGIALDALALSSSTISVLASSGFFVVVTIYIGSPSV
ncbi:hypothetical protein Tco_0549987, partial [Tanacetum coccineum]